jgi:hypothetical protein
MREGERPPIDELDEIYQYADRLQSTPARYE